MPRIIPKARTPITRGDSYTWPIHVPTAIYTTGALLFFALKIDTDDDPGDTEALIRRDWTDVDIDSQDADTVTYALEVTPAETFALAPGTYRAEVQYVSADASLVRTFPDPNQQLWVWIVAPDVNRRTA